MPEMRLSLGRCRQVVEHRKVVSSLMHCALRQDWETCMAERDLIALI